MIIEVKVNNLAARAVAMLSALAVCALLIFSALVNCVVGMLTDPRVSASRELLTAGIAYVPNSAPLNARLAEAEMGGEDRDISSIQNRATRAVNLSPWDYRNRLLLATVKEAAGDRAAAEQALQEALALAPNYTEVRWRLANLLLREGKLAKAVVEFRAANASNSGLLPGTLDLLWRVSAGNLVAVQAVTPDDPKSRLLLAQFLLKQSRASDAITVFAGIDRHSLVALSESSAFISSLMSEGRIEEARGLWVGLVSGTYAQPGRPLPGIWNGSFESDISKSLAQFDWAISRNEYAAPGIDSSVFRTGSRSLRIDFAGRDTARLDGQIKQTILLRPGARYRLECYAKTDRLETPEGPRVVVTDNTSSTELAASDPLPGGSNDWRRIAIDFTAPANARAATMAIKRIPKFSYDNPTRGTAWFDDFVLTELVK
ncbi:MAG: tetratricopeptide repeat protein [Acidobacteriota bacterium]